MTASIHCYWCGTETFPSAQVGPTHPKSRTIDHIRSKPECVSAKEYRSHDNKVTACFRCNQQRSQEWTVRFQQGLVHPTEWSLKQNEKKKRRQARKDEAKQEQEFLKHCLPCPVVRVNVPEELSEAWGK